MLFRSILNENREVLREQHALVEDDLAAGDLPAAVHAAEDILALPDQEIRLGLDAVSIDEKPALDLDLGRRWPVRLRVHDLDVRDHVTDPRGRLLGPVHAGEDLLHAPRERVLALVEPVEIGRASCRERV